MSVSSMANLAFARRKDVASEGKGPDSTKKVAKSTGQRDQASTSATSALASMAAYIPTEVLTVYVAVLAALGVTVPSAGSPASSPSGSPLPGASLAPVATAAPSQSASDVAAGAAFTPLPIYLLFIILVPVVVWGLYARNAKAANKPLPKSIGAWPKWEMVAGTAAFAIWAAALPSSPLAQFNWFSAALAGIAALIVSMLIGLFAPLFASTTLKNS